MDMDMQRGHGSAAWTGTQHVLALDKQRGHGHSACTGACSMYWDMQHVLGHAACTGACSMDVDTQHRYGHAAGTLVLGYTHERAENLVLPSLEIYCIFIFNLVPFRFALIFWQNYAETKRKNECQKTKISPIFRFATKYKISISGKSYGTYNVRGEKLPQPNISACSTVSRFISKWQYQLIAKKFFAHHRMGGGQILPHSQKTIFGYYYARHF